MTWSYYKVFVAFHMNILPKKSKLGALFHSVTLGTPVLLCKSSLGLNKYEKNQNYSLHCNPMLNTFLINICISESKRSKEPVPLNWLRISTYSLNLQKYKSVGKIWLNISFGFQRMIHDQRPALFNCRHCQKVTLPQYICKYNVAFCE